MMMPKIVNIEKLKQSIGKSVIIDRDGVIHEATLVKVNEVSKTVNVEWIVNSDHDYQKEETWKATLPISKVSFIHLGDRIEWQPIETAPKDGTRILGFHKEDLGYYYSMHWTRVGLAWIGLGCARKPDFWMPLPDAPK